MLKFVIFLCVILQNFIWLNATDVCYAPFTDFLKCVISDAESKLQSYEKEIDPPVQGRIKTCFRQTNCEEPDFNKATVDFFLVEPWSSRLKTVLDLLETTDPRVQTCMMDYFKGMAERKIQQCVRTYGPLDVKNFEMPPIPETKNLDITKLKQVVLNRMMIFFELQQCTRSTADDNKLQGTIDCIKLARSSSDETLCYARENCRNNRVTTLQCLDRLDKVLKAACDCAEAEKDKHLENWKELKDAIFSVSIFTTGGLESQYKQCYEQNGLPYPQDKVSAVKKAIQDAIRDILVQGGLPQSVKEALSTAGGALKDIADEWKKLFCSDCSAAQTSVGTNDAKRMREVVARHDNPSQNSNQNNFLEKLRNLFGVGGNGNQQQMTG